MKRAIPELNLFMMCAVPNASAFRTLPDGYRFRTCRRDELDVWKYLSVADPQYFGFMTEYYDRVYSPKSDVFFQRCWFACDEADTPIGTCFVWKAYDKINTIHWFRVLPEHEGKGIGRALLAKAMQDLASSDYPAYIHTHPTSYRAIKLYSDFGFQLLSDPIIGYRNNDLYESLPYLKEYMPESDYANLRITKATKALLEAAGSSEFEEF